MKKSIILGALMGILGFYAQAQNDTMYVMKSGEVIHKISVKSSDVDSIIFYQPKTQINLNTVKDIDGNVYKTVKIGEQTWMAENLRVEKYNDGTAIPLVTDKSVWASNSKNLTKKPMMSYYDNNLTNKAIYGALYNWYVVSSTTNGGKNVCPVGWHVPSDVEWTILTNYVGASAGTKLKSKTGWTNNLNGTDSYSFSGVPGGNRNLSGSYLNIGSNGYLWSSTSNDDNSAWGRYLYYNSSSVDRNYLYHENGFSVRCVKD